MERVREPTVVVRGDLSDRAVDYAREKLTAVASHAPGPVLDLQLRLDRHADPVRERPYHVEASIDLDGRIVRAHRSAETLREAADLTMARLRRQMEASAERPQAMLLRHRDTEGWQHEDVPITSRVGHIMTEIERWIADVRHCRGRGGDR